MRVSDPNKNGVFGKKGQIAYKKRKNMKKGWLVLEIGESVSTLNGSQMRKRSN